METVLLDAESLLDIRRINNSMLFSIQASPTSVYLLTDTGSGILLKAELSIHSELFDSIRSFRNRPIPLDSLMLSSPDFGKHVGPYALIPLPGFKLIITSIVVRFPDNLSLAASSLIFKIFKSYDGKSPVTPEHPPVVHEEYHSVKDLLHASNTPYLAVSGLNFSTTVLEIKFRYADSDLSNTSKLTLNSRLNERLEAYTSTGQPLLNTFNAPLTEACYALFNTKRALDF